jgi:hypothetical protein
VHSIWQRHDLDNFRKHLRALGEKVAREGIVLTDAQIAALEKKAHDDEASGEIETALPGLGSQDTFYVGNLKGVGRIYQQTFVDTYFINGLILTFCSTITIIQYMGNPMYLQIAGWLHYYERSACGSGKYQDQLRPVRH